MTYTKIAAQKSAYRRIRNTSEKTPPIQKMTYELHKINTLEDMSKYLYYANHLQYNSKTNVNNKSVKSKLELIHMIRKSIPDVIYVFKNKLN